MAVFTSAYKALAHGALNWDTQLDADMTTLETILRQAAWSPQIGGTGFTLGTNGGTNGYATRLGQHITYNGRLLFGSSSAWGTGTPSLISVNTDGNLDPTLSTGTGLYFKAAGGNPIPLVLNALTASSFAVWVATSGGSSAPSLGIGSAPAQSDQLLFRIDAVLA